MRSIRAARSGSSPPSASMSSHLGRAIAAVWDGAPEGAAAAFERDLDASAETAPGTAAIEQEADEIRIAEAAAVLAPIRLLADGLGLVLEPEASSPPD